MTFFPILPALLPRVEAMVADAITDEGGAVEHLQAACRNADVPPGELVVWAWVFDVDIEHVLLVDHPRFGELLPPGGRVETGENPIDAVTRELREECGLEARLWHLRPALVDRFVGAGEGGPVETYGIAFAFQSTTAATIVSEPGQPAAWFPLATPPERSNVRHWRRVSDHARWLRRQPGIGPS